MVEAGYCFLFQEKKKLRGRETKSVLLLRLTLVNLSLRVSKGAGMKAFAAARHAVVLSLFPDGTVHFRPPDCNYAYSRDL